MLRWQKQLIDRIYQFAIDYNDTDKKTILISAQFINTIVNCNNKQHFK